MTEDRLQGSMLERLPAEIAHYTPRAQLESATRTGPVDDTYRDDVAMTCYYRFLRSLVDFRPAANQARNFGEVSHVERTDVLFEF
ncbi:hypothetical protein QCE47_26860 [Caballeronia sp. LZ025]|uniref:hypothetical protein n=1 Tax=Caballeronia TaxID=1827195 RepID=UPI001FD29967|nr:MULTISPECIES: hypothetical protein [Caballeronia]MDR5735943.1 hypothetical protein [Caballeronia sp. LZ025]